MKLLNESEVLHSDFVRDVVRFVRPPGISRFTIEVLKTKGPNHAIAYPSRRFGRIKIWINLETRFPHRQPGRGGYLPSIEFGLDELVVHYVAHELRHLWQAAVPSGRRVWGARGRYSERDADAYAIRKVREWRRRGLDCKKAA